jgi:hypothetical protein
MLALYTEEQLGAAFQIYVRAHAENKLDALPFEKFRELFEFQFLAMSDPDMVFNGGPEDPLH